MVYIANEEKIKNLRREMNTAIHNSSLIEYDYRKRIISAFDGMVEIIVAQQEQLKDYLLHPDKERKYVVKYRHKLGGMALCHGEPLSSYQEALRESLVAADGMHVSWVEEVKDVE